MYLRSDFDGLLNAYLPPIDRISIGSWSICDRIPISLRSVFDGISIVFWLVFEWILIGLGSIGLRSIFDRIPMAHWTPIDRLSIASIGRRSDLDRIVIEFESDVDRSLIGLRSNIYQGFLGGILIGFRSVFNLASSGISIEVFDCISIIFCNYLITSCISIIYFKSF